MSLLFSNADTASSITDRNTVGKNGAIGINTSYPTVALNPGDGLQTNPALNGVKYTAIRVPEGKYNGQSYVGIPTDSNHGTLLQGMNLRLSGNWEVIGYGGHMGSGMGGNLMNSQNYISWASGWSSNLPYGTYRALAVYGYCSDGGVHINISIGGANVAHSYGTYWNCDDVTFTGGGAFRVFFDSNLTYRNPTGVLIIVLHKYS